jgi:AcrR family transcriptional regulator
MARQAAPETPRPTKERIIEAAREVFRRDGISSTPMDDIAALAGIARPNVYRYFASRKALIQVVLVEEIRQVNAERWRRFTLSGPVKPLILDALMLGHDLANDDYLARIAFDREALGITADLVSEEPAILDAQFEFWGPVLAYGRARHEIAEHLDNEQIVRWFLAAHVTLAERPQLVPNGDVLGWFRNFVVPPVLAP